MEVKDCILRIGHKEKSRELDMETICSVFFDRTGFEAFDSHIHVIDYLNEFRYGLFEGLRFFLQLTRLWSRRLTELFPSYRFHIVLSYDKKDCVLRFYRLRNNESPWIDMENLNEYNEAVLVETIGSE